MRVAFDISRLYLNQTGIGTYIRNLQTAFEQLPHPDLEIIYLKPNFLQNSWYQTWPTPLTKIATQIRLNFWYQIELPWRLWRLKCDILFSPDPASPVFAPCPSVITLHDMLVEMYPQYYGRIWRWLYHLLDQNALRRADSIICVSETTRRDLLIRWPMLAKRVQVVPNAPDPDFVPLTAPQIEPTLAKYGLTSQNFLLFVGGTNPRKNLVGLLAAFRSLMTDWPNLKLVIVGINAGQKSGSYAISSQTEGEWQKAFGIVTELQVRLVTPGYVAQRELVELYNGATALVFPSFYEGFGLPPLEAMACGCSVVVSNTGALPEVVGEAALTFNPNQPTALATQLQRLMSDPNLRDQLRQAGNLQVKKFDWHITANHILEIIRSYEQYA